MRRLTIISIATLFLVLGAGNAHAVKSVQQSCGVAACPQGFHHPLVDHTDRVQECARSQDQTWTCYGRLERHAGDLIGADVRCERRGLATGTYVERCRVGRSQRLCL
jgi:hypothetical protein